MNLQATVNALVEVQDRIGELKAQEAALKGALIESGYDVVEGTDMRAVIADVNRRQVNWKLIAEKLGASRQIITAHTRTSSYKTVRLYEGDAS